MAIVRAANFIVPADVHAVLYRAREGLRSNALNVCDVYFLKFDGTLEMSRDQIQEYNAAIDSGEGRSSFKYVPMENGRIVIEATDAGPVDPPDDGGNY